MRKTWLDKCLKSSFSEHPSTVNMLKGAKHLLNLDGSTFITFFIDLKERDLENVSLSNMWAWEHFYHISSLWGKLSWKMSVLLICGILGPCVNTLTADNKYSLQNRATVLQPIQVQLSKKQSTFSQIFVTFLKSKSIFKHFERKNDPQSLCISEITKRERRA